MLAPTDLYTALMAHLHDDPQGDGLSLVTLPERVERFAQARERAANDIRVPLAVQQQREAVQAIDQQLLNRLHQAGYLQHSYPVVLTSANHGTHTLENPLLSDRPQIQMAVDDQGWTVPLVPTEGPEKDMAHPSYPVVSHWATLLHEAAHAELSEEPFPLRTSSLPKAVVDDLNTYLLGPLAHPNGYFHRVFHEIFADTYGLMMLASVLPNQPEVDQEIQNTLWARSQTRQHDLDAALAQRALVTNLPHLTEWGIARMWQDRERWQALDPEGRREQAFHYASEGWLLAILPGRDMGQEALDERLIRYLAREMMSMGSDDGKLPHLLTLWHEDAAHPHSTRRAHWRAAYPQHVAWNAMEPALAKQGTYDHLPSTQRRAAAWQYLEHAWWRCAAQVRQDLTQRAERAHGALLALQTPPPAASAVLPRRTARGLR